MVSFSFVKHPRQRRPHKSKAPVLHLCPQRRAVVIKSFETTPRKPNSAKRRVAKVFVSTKRRTNIYLEGIGINRLSPHSVVLVRGHGPRDLPGVRYHAIRGVKDFPALTTRKKGRSKYGVKLVRVLNIIIDNEKNKKLKPKRFLQYLCRKNLRGYQYYF